MDKAPAISKRWPRTLPGSFISCLTPLTSSLLPSRRLGGHWLLPSRRLGGHWLLPSRRLGGHWLLPFRRLGGHWLLPSRRLGGHWLLHLGLISKTPPARPLPFLIKLINAAQGVRFEFEFEFSVAGPMNPVLNMLRLDHCPQM
jgi:hypothetical protein